MAVAYAASSAVGVASGTANVVITKSDLGTVAAGDLLLCHCYSNNSSSTWSATGFTNVSASGDQAILWRVADGTEGSTITVTRATNTAAGAVVQMVRITGADTVSPIDAVTITVTSGTNISLQSVTSTGTGRYLFEFVGKAVAGATGYTAPGTATKRYDVAATGATTWQVAGGDESGIGSGATGTRAWTVNNTGADRGALVLVKAGTATQSATVSLDSTSTLAASPSGQQSASATLASTSAIGTTIAVNRVGTISLASTSSLAAYPGVDKATALASFWSLFNTIGSSRINIGHLGASLVEGYPCTADKTIQQYLAERFRTTYGVTNHGYGYMGLPSGSMLGINPWSITAGTGGSVGTSSATSGWGGKHQVWFTGPLATSPIIDLDLSTLDNLGAWTSFDMNVTRVSTYSSTGGKYRIDGGSWVTFSLAAASGVSVDKLHVASAPTTSVEITIDTAATSSFVIVDGVVGYSGDESSGIQVHGYGHAGYKVSQWQVDANPTYGYRYDQALQDLDLLILQDLGVNDAQSISSATFKTNLYDFIDYLKLVHTCPMVMVSVQDLSPQVTYVEPWANYVQVLREAASDYGMPFLDFAGLVPTYATTPSLYYTDHIHGATDGSMYSLMADTIYDFIAPPSSSVSSSATLASTSTLAITPLVKAQASPTLVSTSALTVTGRATAQSTATLASTSTLSVTGSKTVSVSPALASTSALAIGAVRVQPATATLASTSTLGVTGQQKASVTSTLASTSALAVATAATQSATAALASTSTLAISGLAQARATAAIASTSTLGVTASAQAISTAALTSTSALVVSAVRAPVATVALASTSTLAVSGLSAQAGTINLVSTSTFGGTGFLTIRPGIIFLQSTSALGVTGREDRFATVSIASTSALGISIAHPATVSLTSTSTLSTGAQALPSAMPTFVSESTLFLQGVAQTQALATLISMSTLSSGAGKQHTGSVALVSTSALAVIGGTYVPGSTFSSIIIDGFQREISGMWVIVGGAKRPVSSLSVIVGGTKHTTVL